MMTMEYVTVGDVRVRVWSGGAGPTLLYLHGFENHPGDARFLRSLCVDRTVIAPEHPGFGTSDLALEHIVDIADLVVHFRRLVEKYVDGPVDVVGHCLGGMFAGELAAVSPNVVRKLVLVNPYGLWLDSHPLPDPFVLTPGELRRAKWCDPEKAPEQDPNADVCEDSRETSILRSQNLGAAARFLWPVPDRGLSRRLNEIRAETLIVHGASDGLLPSSYAKEFARMIPHADLESITNAGHVPMFETTSEFVTKVLTFLR